MRLDALAIGSHPDDVEMGCGGTLALLVDAGYRVGILHLTSGERGTRGTVEERRQEARRAGEILGASTVEFLDFGDGGLRHGEAEEDILIEVFRRLRPELVFCTAPCDRHPDHGRAHALVTDVAFYAGLRRRDNPAGTPDGAGEPHRPGMVAAYLQHDPFVPDFVVDVTGVWERKQAALAVYASQLYTGGEERSEPETKVSSRPFREMLEARGRHYGSLIGAERGEPFHTGKPLRVTDPMAHLLPEPR